jgi:nucleoside phosphorylase
MRSAVMAESKEISLAQAQAYVDVGIITMKSEEFIAVLKRFPPEFEAHGKLQYNISRFVSAAGHPRCVAIVRTNEQGDISAQSTANSLIEDLRPTLIVLVGIAGAKPELEFTLGDVIVANRMYDFNVTAANSDGSVQYAIRGSPAHRIAQVVAANLTANADKYGEWFSEAAIGMPRPPVSLTSRNFGGPENWRRKVREALSHYFSKDGHRRQPIVLDGAIASASTLVKDPMVFMNWLAMARDLKAIDMEISGVFEAARSIDGDVPVIVIRGLSDVVGFKRDGRWTDYACHAAASFTLALLTSDLPGIALHKGIEEDAAAAVIKAADALDSDDSRTAQRICEPWLERLAGFESDRAITLRTYCNVISAEARRREGEVPFAFGHLDTAQPDANRIKDKYQHNFLLGRLWRTRGLAERDRGNLDEARKALKASGSHYEEIDVASGSMDALTELATIEENANQYGAALQYYERVEQIAERNGLPGGLALARRGRATIAYYRDDIPTVVSQAKDARERFSALGQEIGVAECEVLLGRADTVRGKWNEAVQWFEAARGRFHRLALPRREAGMLLQLGHLALLRNKIVAAKQYVVEADDYFAKAGYRPGRTSSFLLMGAAERQLGSLASARDALQRARQYAEGSEDPAIFSQIGLEEGLIALAASELPLAERLLREAEAQAYRGQDLATESRAIAARIPISAADKALADAAIERLVVISETFITMQRPLEAAATDVLIAEQMNRLGKVQEAGERARSALQVAISLGSRLVEGEALLAGCGKKPRIWQDIGGTICPAGEMWGH